MDCVDFLELVAIMFFFARYLSFSLSMKDYTNEAYKHSELTAKIIGCAMKVHSTLGNGFQEVIYQRSLAIEMTGKGSVSLGSWI